VNEGELSQREKRNYDIENMIISMNHNGKKSTQNFFNPNEKLSKVEVVTFHEFFKFIFRLFLTQEV
jgi:hypothetical protein